MSSLSLSRLLLLGAAAAAVFGCAHAVRVASVSDAPTVEIMNASGTLAVANSRSGQAIFQAARLAPGRSITGTVQLSNTGTLAGDLSLAQLDVQNEPGPNGGPLSSALELTVEDITGGNSIPVFSGRLDGLGTRSLGSIAPGETRTYRFAASLPNTGRPAGPTVGDNAYVGSHLTVRYVWTATADDTPGPGPEPEQRPQPPTPNPATEVKPLRFWFKVDPRALRKRGRYDVLVRCDRACSLSTWGALKRVQRGRVPRRSAWLPMPDRTAHVRVKLRRHSRAALRRALQKRPRVALRVYLNVVPVGGASRTYAKTIWIKRSKAKRR